MRAFLPILFLSALCSCSGHEDTSWSALYGEDSSDDGLASASNSLSRRQHLLDEEIDYYLKRHNPLDEGFDMVTRYAQQGDATMTAFLPEGRLTPHNMRPLHEGKALVRDARGRRVIGRFHADTLVSGVRIDSTGFYAGMMNRRGEAWGHGIYRSADGTYFEGHWEHDQREGFGLSIGPGHLNVGVWLRDKFRGEHMSYHSERIYGIDISRYQHEKGRRRFPVNWSDLRITHLGRRISQERVIDKLDYPVQFVYIKSTEGVTIENHYYTEDDACARQHGLHVGAYHFLSTKTPPEDQAHHFLQHAHFRHGDLPPMLDVEPSDKQIADMGGPQVLFDYIRIWLKAVEQATHTRPLLYINQGFVNNYLYLAPDLKRDYHFWIARYGEYKPDIHLDIWQLSGDGRVKGFMTEVDLNVFNGYQGQWDEFLRTSTVP